MGGREVPYNEKAVCDGCGKKGAFDFMGDYFCENCVGPASTDIPYQKKYHKAKYFGPNGEVSALCFKTPKPIDLKKELWTIRNEAVTCEKCLKKLRGAK